MRELRLTGVACVLAGLLFAPAAQAQDWIVGYKSYKPAARAAKSMPHGFRILDRDGRAVLVQPATGKTATQIKQALLQNPAVRYVEPNRKIHTYAVPNDSLWGELWGMSNIGLPEAWTQANGAEGSGVIVAVTDTGIQANHPDLANQIWTNTGETANGIDDDGNGLVDDLHGWDYYDEDNNPDDSTSGHGTHVSGTVAGERGNGQGVAGVAPGSKVMPLRFIGPDGGSNFAAAAVINYAVAKGAKVINASWGGGGYSQSVSDAIDNAKNNGVLFVAAAGNSGKNLDQSPDYPSSYPHDNILVVSAIDSSNGLAYFSNYGQTGADMGAPGVAVTSSFPINQYTSLSGTSMAAPHVAGAAADLWSKNPAASYLDIKNSLMNGGTATASLAGKTVSGKRLNLAGAFNRLDSLDSGPQAVSAPVLNVTLDRRSKRYLNCTAGTWDPSPSYISYSWTKNGQVVPGWNGNSYLVPTGDLGSSFVCQVSAGIVPSTLRTQSSNSVVPNNPPPLAGAAQIVGFNGMDSELTCSPGAWAFGPISYSYQWYRDGAALAGETSNLHTIVSQDKNHSLTCVVSGSNLVGSATSTSPAFAVGWPEDNIAPAPPTWTSALNDWTNANSWTFKFRGEKDARFYCSLDGNSYQFCGIATRVNEVKSWFLSNWGEGPHTLSVKQKDRAGNEGTYAFTAWVTDLTPPGSLGWAYSFDPGAGSGETGAIPSSSSKSIKLFFAPDEGNSVMCSLNKTRLAVCGNAIVFSKLRAGVQTLRFQQKDRVGNLGAMTQVSWVVLP